MSNATELPTVFQQYIHLSRYARWLEDKNRRETWDETVQRYMDFMKKHLQENYGYDIPAADYAEVHSAILKLEVMPSMRALMTAGEALERDHIAGFNCSYLAIDNVRAFDETLYILMCGTGVGFSVERQDVSQLPAIPEALEPSDDVIVVADSKLGWARAYRSLLTHLWAGSVPKWDTSRVRPPGARLKVFGGRASGPAPLEDLFRFTVELFQKARGRQLKSIECHDLVCKIADIVVVGGVRRAALISLSNLSDIRMREAKAGEWWNVAIHRKLANNSVAYTEKPEVGQFMEEWTSLYKSHSGERGFFNRQAAAKKSAAIGRDAEHAFGTNPCGEIILRPNGFCNLSEIVARSSDKWDDLMRKARLATIIGTWQSTLTNYRYVRNVWGKNAEQERLLGVSITGIMDCPALQPEAPALKQELETMREFCRFVNKDLSAKIGIEPSAALTCVKPSGTVSQLVDAASGIHRRHARKYIRRVRNDVKDPLTGFMLEANFQGELDITNDQNMVFSFPVEAPAGSDLKEYTAIEQLEFWLVYSRYWCDHNPSTTIYVEEHEWPGVGAWVWEHFDEIGGLSFLPKDGGTYRQMPYETVDDLLALQAVTPTAIDWTLLQESTDGTTSSQSLACQSGFCEL
jgi:ribonucleoside-triphosphate reductase (thioredoxin)